MQATHESYSDDHSFWAFVDLKPEVPVTYVMPGRRAAEVAQALHTTWLAIPGRKANLTKTTPCGRSCRLLGHRSPKLHQVGSMSTKKRGIYWSTISTRNLRQRQRRD
jgi:hypothetical protein